MGKMYSYKGTRWYKCDLHLHTVGSECFQDKAVTSEQWVQVAIDSGLNCVAITDHNNGISIDEIKSAAKDTGLTIFPGVELTCDSSKVHLLIIFDVNKSSADIRDFIACAGIRMNESGQPENTTSNSIFDIADLANKDGAIVIPAHIDEYSGLDSISVEHIKKFYNEYDINAVQVVHKEFLDPKIQINENKELKSMLNDYYNNPSPEIDYATIKKWYTPVKYAIENNLAILTFSDNPHESKNSKHGVWGIGKQYTWIKMGEKPSLEGLRQAFLMPEYRIRNIFDCPTFPYKKPTLWIKSVSILNTTITARNKTLKVEFSPQLNAIIGGRGSGKSSILRFIRGVFNRTIELDDLNEILKDHSEFYRKEYGRPPKGVLTDESIITIEFIRNEVLHKITASKIIDSSNQEIQIKKLNKSGKWEVILDDGYLDFFEFEIYSQKQIYEIAQEPNALRERIDKSIDSMDKLKQERDHVKNKFFEKSTSIRTTDKLLSRKGKIKTRIKDLETNIKKLQESGINELLLSREKYSKEKDLIEVFQSQVEERKDKIGELAKSIDIENIDLSAFDDEHQKVIKLHVKNVVGGFSKIKDELLKLQESANKIETNFKESIDATQWKNDVDENIKEFNRKKNELEKEGINIISSFEKFINEKTELIVELEEIKTKEITRETDLAERKRLQDEYLLLCKRITENRREFLKEIMTGDKVKVNVKPFRDRIDFERQLRKCIQRESSTYQSDIDLIMNHCFNGNVENKINEFRRLFLNIRNDKDTSIEVGGYFVNHIKKLNDAQIDEIEIMLPEDEIEIQYKSTEKDSFKSLSTASAGQKTTAILTFILSYGNMPLILDQPEDDLDNRLIYELVVDKLMEAKEKRQIIVVTHNANIPVNGDAEYINAMNSESKFLEVIHQGTVEQDSIKSEICQVMEGGEKAFEMRAKRYQLR